MKQFQSIVFLLTSTLVLQAACSSTVPARVTRFPAAPLDKDAKVWVIAQQDRETIVASLRNAGIEIASDLKSMGYSLEVRVGGSRGNRKCGSIHNIVYILIGQGQRLMVIKGRGVIGCGPGGAIDEMSLELARHLN